MILVSHVGVRKIKPMWDGMKLRGHEQNISSNIAEKNDKIITETELIKSKGDNFALFY